MFLNPTTNIIILTYVDDCLFFGRTKEAIDQVIADIHAKHDLEEQNADRNVFEYLGIEINMEGDFVEFLQEGLTNKILRTVGMEDCNTNDTPAKEAPLTSDRDGEPFNEGWEYASVCGMLMYLVNTRPDIQFSVHQASKYTHNPMNCHANAVKKICRYLQKTKKRGIRFKKETIDPNNLQINCYVDASFCPSWKDTDDESSSKSRTGYVIRIDDSPVQFASQGQQETTLSTTECEYVALSTAMRELLWVRRIVHDITTGFGINYNRDTVIHSTVFEDNQGAIAVAKRPDLTRRTRHLHTKYHHFKENLGDHIDGGSIRVDYIPTHLQIADILTKGLGDTLFRPLRNKLMGWDNYEIDNVQKGELEYDRQARKSNRHESVRESADSITPIPYSEQSSNVLEQQLPSPTVGANRNRTASDLRTGDKEVA